MENHPTPAMDAWRARLTSQTARKKREKSRDVDRSDLAAVSEGKE